MDNLVPLLLESLSDTIDELIAAFLGIQESDDQITAGLINIIHFLVDEDNPLQIVPRPINMPRILNYYEELIPRYSDDDYYSHFRMTRRTFGLLSQAIQTHIQSRRNTPGEREAEPERNEDDDEEEEEMPLDKKIYITIWILATPDSFRSVADRFGVSKSTAYDAYKAIVFILCELMPRYIRWPDENELAEIENVFHMRSGGFPGVVGAIDGCHIQMRQPPGNANDYYNRKGTHSIVLQGTCDHNGKFIDVLVGAPGRAHDARIWRNSSLYRKITNDQVPLLPPDKHLLGDSGYPLHVNLLTPFRDNGMLTARHINYNIKHASIRCIIERAFGRLKNKFRRLYLLDVRSVWMANLVVGASCVLHNFILIHEGVRRDNTNNRGSSPPPDDPDNDLDEYSDDEDDDVSLNAIEKRLELMESLA